MKNFRAYYYKAIDSTPAEKHILCTRVMKGQTYLIRKIEDSSFVSISGKLFDKDGGCERVFDKHLHISRVKNFVELIDLTELANTCPNN